MAKDLYQPGRVRGGAYAEHMQRATEAGRCVFCDIDFTVNKPLNKKGEIDLSGSAWKYWWIWWNPFPQNHQHHLMFVLKRHVACKTPKKIFLKEWYELIRAVLWYIVLFKFYGGGFDFRFGDTRYNAGTIPGHFHAQIQAPWGTGQVFALFYADLSPIEQARTANRIIYRNKELENFEGYVVHSQSYILNRNFHWEKFNGDYSMAYVHSSDALKHIAAIFTENELRPEWIIRARYSKVIGTTPLSNIPEEFTFQEVLEIAKDFNEEAYGRDKVLGYSFRNSDGFFLSRDFEWDATTPVVHAEQAYEYIIAFFHEPSIIIFDAEMATNGSDAVIDGNGTPLKKHLKRFFYR